MGGSTLVRSNGRPSRLLKERQTPMNDEKGPTIEEWELPDLVDFLDVGWARGVSAQVGKDEDVWLEATRIATNTYTLKFLNDGRVVSSCVDCFGQNRCDSEVGPDPEKWWEALGIKLVPRDY